MITADTLKTLTMFTAPALTRAIRDAGYKGDGFKDALFLGMTNAGEFCYSVTYQEEDRTGKTKGKVFLMYDPTTGAVSADY